MVEFLKRRRKVDHGLNSTFSDEFLFKLDLGPTGLPLA